MDSRCLLWITVLLVVGCVGPSKLALRLAEARVAARKAMLAEGPSWRSREGYGRTRWGMTPQEVGAVEPTAVVTPSGLKVATSVAGNPAEALYRFSRKRLFTVIVEVDTPIPEMGYRELLAGLSAKYGRPNGWDDTTTATIRTNALNRVADGLAESSAYIAGVTPPARKPLKDVPWKFAGYAHWDGVQTQIELIVVESLHKATTRIRYSSTVIDWRPEGL